MVKSTLRTGRNANESTAAENMKKKNSLKQVKTRAVFPAENGILENYFKNGRKVKAKLSVITKVKSQRYFFGQKHPSS